LINLLRTYLVLNESNGSSKEPISLEIWNRVRRGKCIVEQQKNWTYFINIFDL